MSEVLVPALVAAVVALLIEYAAKPWLDARKERILGRQRAVAAFGVALRRLCDRLYPLVRHGEAWDLRRTPAEASAALAAVNEALDRLSETTPYLPLALFAAVRPVVLDLRTVLGEVAALSLPLSDKHDELRSGIDDLERFLRDVLIWFELPRRRWVARRRVVRLAVDFIAP